MSVGGMVSEWQAAFKPQRSADVNTEVQQTRPVFFNVPQLPDR